MTCIHCDAPAVHTLGTTGYCATHLEQFLAPIRDRVTLNGPFTGRATITGLMRPEHGPGAFDATCDRCSATWVALYDREPCYYCQARHEHILAHQAELPLPGLDQGIDGSRDAFVEASQGLVLGMGAGRPVGGMHGVAQGEHAGGQLGHGLAGHGAHPLSGLRLARSRRGAGPGARCL